MKYIKYKSEFIKIAREKLISEDTIEKCLEYAKKLIEKELPIIYSLNHFCKIVWYNRNYINRSTYPQRQRYMYRHYKIPKKNWWYRDISEPLPSLKEIQYWILNNILKKIKVSKFAKSYTEWVNIKHHVKYHKWAEKVLTLDIADFFWWIKYLNIYGIFQDLWYSNSVSNKLARICSLHWNLCQWSPCSPYISNVYMKSFDESVFKYCKDNWIKFTRYSDDMAFSGDFDESSLISFVKKSLSGLWLFLNESKTKLMKKNDQQIISWIIVNKKIQIPKVKRNKIRNTMFYIKKFWLNSHIETLKITKANYLKHLLWKINYVLYINPKDKEFFEYKNYLIQLLD